MQRMHWIPVSAVFLLPEPRTPRSQGISKSPSAFEMIGNTFLDATVNWDSTRVLLE